MPENNVVDVEIVSDKPTNVKAVVVKALALTAAAAAVVAVTAIVVKKTEETEPTDS